MFRRVKTSIIEEGMMDSLALRSAQVTVQTREPELITVALINACVGFLPAHY